MRRLLASAYCIRAGGLPLEASCPVTGRSPHGGFTGAVAQIRTQSDRVPRLSRRVVRGTPQAHFFSNFSIRQLVENSKSSDGLTCDVKGGGGVGTHAGGIGFGGTRFNSHKSDSFTCRLISNEPVAFETLYSLD